MTFTRHRVDISEEKRMLVGLIVSDRVCQEILPLVDDSYLQNPYSPILIKWIKGYYKKYEKAPGKDIQGIFEVEKQGLGGDRAEMVEAFLEKLSDEYERESQINEPYLIDRCVEYLEERSLLTLADKIQANVKGGEKGKAKALVADYRKVARSMTTWSNPFAPEEVNLTMDEERDSLFQMPGALGRLLGPFERGTFISVMAPVKRGKTWFLIELAVMGLLNKFKVAFVSLEMRKERMQQRLYKRLISTGKGDGLTWYPVFDCLNNQDGSCERPGRKGQGDLLDSDGNISPFDEKIEWTTCDACKGKWGGDYNYISSNVHWYIRLQRPKFDIGTVREAVGSFQWWGDNLRLKCYPRFSASLGDVTRDLDLLEYMEGFVPDIVIVDYADILKPERERSEGLEAVNETWMTLAQIGDVRKCLVATATQTNKEAWDARNTKAKNVSQYFMKFAHVEMAFMLSQTPQDKKNNFVRCSVAVSRNEDFNELAQVKILQQLEAGQPLLDSEFETY